MFGGKVKCFFLICSDVNRKKEEKKACGVCNAIRCAARSTWARLD